MDFLVLLDIIIQIENRKIRQQFLYLHLTNYLQNLFLQLEDHVLIDIIHKKWLDRIFVDFYYLYFFFGYGFYLE